MSIIISEKKKKKKWRITGKQSKAKQPNLVHRAVESQHFSLKKKTKKKKKKIVLLQTLIAIDAKIFLYDVPADPQLSRALYCSRLSNHCRLALPCLACYCSVISIKYL
jgi:hypothetical protein